MEVAAPPAPDADDLLGAVLHDESNRAVALRIVIVDGARFVLAAAGRGDHQAVKPPST